MREVAPLVISLTDLMLPLEYWGVPLGRDSHMNAFASRGEIRKHSHRKHLRYHSDSQLIACPYPKCDVVLNSITHLQNHVEKSHQNHCHYGAYLFPGILQAKIAFLAAAFCCSINDRAHGGIYTLINLGISTLPPFTYFYLTPPPPISFGSLIEQHLYYFLMASK